MLHPTLLKTVTECFKLPKQEGDFGIELEIEGLRLPPAPSGWTIKEENSLRGEAYEYVTRNSVHMNSLEKSLRNIHKVLTAEPCVVNLTPRASTHIHMNMQHETFRTVFGMILVYCMVEPIMLTISGQHRNGNLFCLPVIESGDMPACIDRAVGNILAYRADFPRQGWVHRGKYSALNTDPLNTLGSMEFRMFPNTINPDDVLRWAGWLMAMKVFVKTFPDDFNNLFPRINRDPGALIDIFRDHPGFSGLFHNPDGLVRYGLEFAYEIYRPLRRALNFVETPKKKKKKPEIELNWRDAMFDLVNQQAPMTFAAAPRFRPRPPHPQEPDAPAPEAWPAVFDDEEAA